MLNPLLRLKAYRLIPICLFLYLCIPVPLHAEPAQPYSDSLLENAKRLKLSEDHTWSALLHIPDGAKESLIDDPRFFLATSGKTAPDAELAATITAFFSTTESGDNHPLCRFPARREWLKERLALDDTLLPHPVCRELATYVETIQPRSASLMFPAAYLNSPASMFGHTFVRIDGNFASDLLGYAVNYAAQADEGNGFVYAWKGIFGLYHGYYSILPHYAKVREYSGIEHRDIWEYRLNLNPDEVRRMTLHAWELREIYSDYYFFDENCSYNILFLLAVARPAAQLNKPASAWVIPLDTIATMRKAGLVDSTRYRPSQGQKIRSIASTLTSTEIDEAIRLSKPEQKSVSDTKGQKAALLDLATELLQFRYAKNLMDQDVYKVQLLRLLKERSAYGAASIVENIPKPPEPDQGHASSRISISSGTDRGRAVVEAGFRPAYHDLTDPGNGFLEGAQIQFMNTAVRYFPDREQTRLERLDIIDIISLADFERIFRQFSWKINGGLEQLQNRNGVDALVFHLATGSGIAKKIGNFGMIYGLADLSGELGDRLSDWYSLGFGGTAGIRTNPASPVQLGLAGKTFLYPFGDRKTVFQGEINIGISISRNNSVNGTVRYTDTNGYNRQEIMAGWNLFF